MRSELLSDFYPQITSLNEYIDKLSCNSSQRMLEEPNDSKEYIDWLRETRVSVDFKGKRSFSTPKKTKCEDTDMPQVLNRCLTLLLGRIKPSENVLTQGYRKSFTAFGQIECQFPNTLHDFWLDKKCEILLKRVGEAVIIHLLTECAVFKRIENECYVQVAGSPLFNHKTFYSKPLQLKSGKDFKKLIDRSQILYQRTLRNMTGTWMFGISDDHLFRQMRKSKVSQSQFVKFFIPSALDSKGKLHWRIKRARPMFCKIVENQFKCHYRALFLHYCPKPDFPKVQNPQFKAMEYCTSPYQVFTFVVSVIQRIFPKEIWGSENNLKLILARVKSFVFMKRFETISMQEILYQFKMSECKWLQYENESLNSSSNEKISSFIYEFLESLFNNLVIPLIATNFYVTESSVSRNKVFYFRHDVWNSLTGPSLRNLTSQNLVKLSIDELERFSNFESVLGVSFIRLVPKEVGMRPITNLKRKLGITENDPICSRSKMRKLNTSINQILSNSFSVLSLESKLKPKLMGATISGLNDVRNLLVDFKNQSCSNDEFFLIKMDLKSAFDNINQELLLKILTDFISTKEYIIQKYSIINEQQKVQRRRFVKEAKSKTELKRFSSFASEKAAKSKNSIFIDQSHYSLESKAAIIDVITSHISNHLVKIGKEYYKQVKGIPQGSALSGILCNIFYGFLESKRINDYFKQFSCNQLCMRFVDDYLIITNDKVAAIQMASFLTKELESVGAIINHLKTLCNFEAEFDGVKAAKLASGEQFPYVGILIDPKSLQVSIDNRYSNSRSFNLTLDPSEGFTVDINRKTKGNLKQKLFTFLKNRCYYLFYDSKLNSIKKIISNLHKMVSNAAFKFYYYLKCVPKVFHIQNSNIKSAIDQGFEFFSWFIRYQSKRNGNQQFSLCVQHIKCIYYDAFTRIFSRNLKYSSITSSWNSIFIDSKSVNRFKKSLLNRDILATASRS